MRSIYLSEVAHLSIATDFAGSASIQARCAFVIAESNAYYSRLFCTSEDSAMMLSNYYQIANNVLTFTRTQGSQFAKQVAGDYNPLHNDDASRFCVPGDLLFAVVLMEYGISQAMQFSFENMITENSSIALPAAASTLAFADDKKNYITVKREGDNAIDATTIASIIKQYVAFSGEAFPHILVPTMSAQNLMINPKRPMVMYQSMSLQFDRLDIKAPTLEPLAPIFKAEGKRGTVVLPFIWKDGEELVGKGEKTMLVSGIVDYDKPAMDELIEKYNSSKCVILGT